MYIIRLRCAICLTWYRPDCHVYHCPICGAIPVRTKATTRHYVRSFTLDKLIPIVRAIPQYDGAYANVGLDSDTRALRSAQALAPDSFIDTPRLVKR